MEMKYWSDYEKYIVMVHGGGNTHDGISLGYQAFLDFKRVKEALISITKRPGGSYSLDDNIYKRTITQSRATQALEKIERCQWDENIRIVANQINAGRMLSPRKMFTSVLKK